MFKSIFIKELKAYLTSISFYVYVFIMFFFVYLYAQNTNPNSTIFNLSHGKEYNVAAIKIAKMFTNWTIAGIFFVMVFVGRSVVKDFQANIHDFFFTTPIKKWQYLGARFLSAFTASLCVFLIIPVAIFLGNLKLSPSLQGPLYLQTFLYPLILMVLPNVLLISSFIFAISTLSRQTIYAYMSSIVLIIMYIILIMGTASMKNLSLRILIDPFGMNALSIASQYWSTTDMNINFMPITPLLMLNRIIWCCFSIFCLIFTYKKFNMTHDRNTHSKKTATQLSVNDKQISDLSIKIFKKEDIQASSTLQKILSLVFLEWKRVLLHPAFVILFGLGMMQWISNVMGNMDGSGTNATPFTSWLLSQSMHLWMYMVPITILFGALIVWRENDHNTHDIYHTMPLTDAQRAISKIFAIFGMQISYLFFSIIVGVLFQILYFNYYDVQLDLYFKRFFGMELLNYFQLTVIVVIIQILLRNKILGLFVTSIIFVFDLIFMDIVKWDIPYLRFAHFPSFTYSNINEYGPYSTLLLNYSLYYLLFSVLMLCLCIFLWKSSENDKLKQRFAYAFKKTKKKNVILFSVVLILFGLQGCYIIYNRYVVNDYYSTKDVENELKEYELQALKYINYPQLSVAEVDLSVDLFPKNQKAMINGFLHSQKQYFQTN